jgi:hypothetical protein
MTGWMLETFVRNNRAAQVHFEACKRLLSQALAGHVKDDGSEASSIIIGDIQAMHKSMAGYNATESSFAPSEEDHKLSIVQALQTSRGPANLSSTHEVAIVFEHFYRILYDDHGQPRLTVTQVQDFMYLWELLITKYSRHTSEPMATITAVYLLINLTNILTDILYHKELCVELVNSQNAKIDHALDYTMTLLKDLCQQAVGQKTSLDHTGLRRTLRLALTIISQRIHRVRHQKQAESLLWSLEGPPIEPHCANGAKRNISEFAKMKMLMLNGFEQQLQQEQQQQPSGT